MRLGLVQLGAEEPGQLDALLEEGQGLVERRPALLELRDDLFEVGQRLFEAGVRHEPSFSSLDSMVLSASTRLTSQASSPRAKDTTTPSPGPHFGGRAEEPEALFPPAERVAFSQNIQGAVGVQSDRQAVPAGAELRRRAVTRFRRRSAARAAAARRSARSCRPARRTFAARLSRSSTRWPRFEETDPEALEDAAPGQLRHPVLGLLEGIFHGPGRPLGEAGDALGEGRLLLDDHLGRRRGRRGADVRDEIGDGEVDLVADRRDDGTAHAADGPGDRLLVERPEILDASRRRGRRS